MNTFIQTIEHAENIAVTGHIRPDGDCIGSCLGVYNYIKDNYPRKKVTVYLEPMAPEFRFLNGYDQVKHKTDDSIYDLFIVLDCSDETRIEPFADLFKRAKESFCVDHHISNRGFCDDFMIDSGVSATCELLYQLFDEDKISFACAECLYTGIVHDTGVFKHSNTTRETMYIAGNLIAKGINTSHIIDDTFYRKTYLQNVIMGYALLESSLVMDGKIIYSFITKKWMDLYGVTGADLNGIIDQLRVTEGVEVAILGYEMNNLEFKVSMRSNDYVDVSKVASYFGGGGHIRAAGCTMKGNSLDVINNLLRHIESQLKLEEQNERDH
ncbi:MAG: bifunctional oligoribonuclease/PAP phosphatase NrnA [Lachnospiraceae bacterium]|nr:bifunctional oligoribonuclease/PAP phosphatase NrnA [Lachnospiraceae bacterium]